ncbi:DNA-binding transcriptional regulator, LacI/PurR family [Terrimicrobium sacchariphilum]|uniref:DNA-binding transcriptional regulator, LacI/PurR family n=1 Tax=Terrimicrobium sacchariphilum TaxID=690879 RepID=A0A146G5D8_TERSA|nr:substrate-binding domain-containing protein [Terrimicrobium sacchariphilum]GAT32622.1 DNA-binding transcriptional regulator, LacI/PurR family [Terrimicrobium sacchariphilum]
MATNSNRTSSEVIARRLLDYISSHELEPPARLPSGRELAAEWKADFSVVNRAIGHLITRGILRRDGYKLFLARTPESVTETPPLHILCPNPKIAAGAAEIASLHGSRVISLDWHWRAYRNSMRRLLEQNCQGLAVWTDKDTPVGDLIEQFRQRAIPTVVLGATGNYPGSMVDIHGNTAGRMAVAHLFNLGHTEIACFHLPGADTSIVDGYQRSCHERNLGSSVSRVLSPDLRLAEVQVAATRLANEFPQVTGIVFTNAKMARMFIEDTSEGRMVPKSLSVVAVGDPDMGISTDPPLSVVAYDYARLGRYAATVLFAQKSGLARGGALPPPERLLIEPQLIARQSTTAPGKAPSRPRATTISAAAKAGLETETHATRRASAAQSWKMPYPAVAKLTARAFEQIDLRPFANRGLHRFKSWLGLAPLLYLPAGRQKIQGVPFDVIPEDAKNPRSSLVLRSHHARDHSLPSEVTIPVNQHARLAYFLHGCGWATDHVKCAEYEMVLEDGSSHALGLVPFGFGPSDEALIPQWNEESTIQDWWPSYQQFDNSRARHLTVTKDGDPEASERFLYTLQWTNPTPEVKLDSIRVKVNPDTRFTLGILAITICNPPAARRGTRAR